MNWDRIREDHIRAAVIQLLQSTDQAQALISRLPLTVSEMGTLQPVAAMTSRSALAIVLGGVATRHALAGEVAVAIGMSDALITYWTDPVRNTEELALAPTELGSALVVKAQAYNRAGGTDQTIALYKDWLSHWERSPDPSSAGPHLAILAAEAYWKNRQYDNAEATLPKQRPTQHLGAASLWDLIKRRIDELRDGNASIGEQWREALQKIEDLIKAVTTLGAPSAVKDVLQKRLDDERRNPPKSAAELAERVTAIGKALQSALSSLVPGSR